MWRRNDDENEELQNKSGDYDSPDKKGFGEFIKDEVGMPCYDLTSGSSSAVDSPFKHLISTGRISALTDRRGNIDLFTKKHYSM